MKQIEYVIKTLAPVTFAEKNNESTLYNTRKYVPGSIFRGMFADRFIRENNLVNAHENEDFYNIFLSGKVRFLPAYPLGRIKNETFEPYVLPLSFMKSKDGKILKDLSNGEKIETGFKKMTGFALKKGSDIYKVNVDTQIEFHMARNGEEGRIHGSSKDGRVFNYEYIEPYQYFKGYIIVDDDMADNVRENLEMLEEHNIYIGRSRSVQYGECSFKVVKTIDYNKEDFAVEKLDKKHCYLYTYTPYIPQYEWQRVDTVAENLFKEINEKLQVSGIDAKIEKIEKKDGNDELIFAATEEYSGYVGVWKVRRERAAAISAGSLLEFKLDNKDDKVIKALNRILYGGLGARVEEGFGQFRLYQPFDSLTLKELEDKQKEDYVLSNEVKQQARKIIKERVLLEVKKQAVQLIDERNIKDEFQSKSKTTLNRIEILMNSNKSKDIIQNEVRTFNKPAIENLRNMFIDRDNLYDILTESMNVKLPYININWEEQLGLNDKEIIEEMRQDLGKDVFIIDENHLYREYFLWFMRHIKKILNEEKTM